MGFGNIVPPWYDLQNTQITVSSFMDNVLKAYRPYRSQWMWINNNNPNYVTVAQTSSYWYNIFLDRVIIVGGSRG
jgi:hypothetical protein